MGCASSKQKRCRHCGQPSYSPVNRSYSLHAHHPPEHEDDSYHVVALTSSTLGSLSLEISNRDDHDHASRNSISIEDSYLVVEDTNTDKNGNEFSFGLSEAKSWSEMIEEKIPKTPVRTPLGEPETINTWELMEGLEDISPFHSPKHFRSFSFPVVRESSIKDRDLDDAQLKSEECIRSSDDETDSRTSTVINDFDPDIISSFRKSLEELPPDKPFYLPLLGSKVEETDDDEDLSLDVAELKNKVNEVMIECHKQTAKDKVVFYFTSLRGIRKTFEDCCYVRMILKSIGVYLDERDVSMHSGFREEMRELLGDSFNGSSLPRVFVGRKYIGGAEDIRELHEDGRLEKLLDGCAKVDDGGACEACGDIRFVPCETCSGSCKIYYGEDHDEDGGEQKYEEGEYGFQRCPDCNENGLIRCPICCD